MATIDVGTVAGISISTVPPSNQAIIWYDTTDGLHKSYDKSVGEWVPMSQAIVSQISDFSDLVNKANLPGGLPIGAFYNVVKRDTDSAWNTLVWVVGSTRIQYVDKLNNIIVEDLAGQGSVVQYVASTNYLFDGVVVTFDAETSKLDIQFQQIADAPIADEIMYGYRLINDNPTLIKRTLGSLVSKSAKNSLSFVNGLYFSFQSAMSGIIVTEQESDTKVVGYKQYLADYTAINKTFEDAKKILQDWQDNSQTLIYSSRLIEVNPVTATVSSPQDLTVSDDIKTAFNKIQGWYNRLKLATGMSLSGDYIMAPNKDSWPVAGDTVEKAISILHKMLYDFNGKASSVIIGGNAEDYPNTPNPSFQLLPDDSVYQAFLKVANNLASLFPGGNAPYAANNLVVTNSIKDKAVTYNKLNDDVKRLFGTYEYVDWNQIDDFSNAFFKPGCVFDAYRNSLSIIDPSIDELWDRNWAEGITDRMWDSWVIMPNSSATFKILGGSEIDWFPKNLDICRVTIGANAPGVITAINVRYVPSTYNGEKTTGYWFMIKYLLQSGRIL